MQSKCHHKAAFLRCWFRGCTGSFLSPANEVCEGYVFTPVRQSFYSHGGGGVFIQEMGVCIRGVRSWADPPPPHRILRDTIDERTVRILLECILVYFFSKKTSLKTKKKQQKTDPGGGYLWVCPCYCSP